MITLMSAGHGPTIENLHYLIDFVVLLSVFVYFLRKPIANFVTERRESLVSEIEEAKKLRAEAEAKLADYDARLGNLQSEIDGIMDDARKAGEAERQRILVEATKAAERIRTDAKHRLDQEQRKLSHDLRVKVVEMALDIAETSVKQKIDQKAQDTFVSEYIDELDKVQGGAV